MPWTTNTEEYGPFDQEDWAWAYTTVPPEAISTTHGSTFAAETLEVEGIVPPDLIGTFYRTGPGKFERGGRRYDHVLDGDGFVAAFEFGGNGRVQYRGRFVETEYFVQEEMVDTVLYRNVFGTQRDGGAFANAFDVNLKNVANTNILEWGNRLWALWEGGRPYELDKRTLATLPPTSDGPLQGLGAPDSTRGITLDEGGTLDQKINLGRSFTAHPHIIDNGTTLVGLRFGQNPLSKDLKMEFVEYDSEWNLKSSVSHTVPNTPAAPHDFSVGDEYYCFFQNPFELDNLPFLFGFKAPTQVLQVPLDRPNLLHVVPRTHKPGAKSSIDEAFTVEIPRYFCIHNLPRAEISSDGSILTLYSNGWDLTDTRFFPADQTSVPFLGAWGGRCPDFDGGLVPSALLYRTIVNLRNRKLVSHQEVIPGLVMEFPTQEDSDGPNGGSGGAIYCSVASVKYESLPGTGHAKVDVTRNSVQYWWYGPKIFTGEITPVRKSNGQEGSWLLTLLFDAAYKRASVAILDSECFDHGPVAVIHLPHALAYCLHGSFAAAAAAVEGTKR